MLMVNDVLAKVRKRENECGNRCLYISSCSTTLAPYRVSEHVSSRLGTSSSSDLIRVTWDYTEERRAESREQKPESHHWSGCILEDDQGTNLYLNILG